MPFTTWLMVLGHFSFLSVNGTKRHSLFKQNMGLESTYRYYFHGFRYKILCTWSLTKATVRRLSYLSALYTEIDKFLDELQMDTLNLSQLWFTSKDAPVKWHYPIGLIFDLYSTDGELLELVVHRGDFPHQKLLTWDHDNVMFDLYIALLKETDFLRNGSVKKVMGLSAADQEKLWSAVERGNHDNFWSVMDHLVVDESDSRKYAIRIYPTLDTVIRRVFDSMSSNILI
jgi:autophagy-related protein 5